MYKRLSLALAAALAIAGAASLTACSDAQVASNNLSKAADNFEINRRIVFFNGITGEYMLSIEGLCSIGSASETKAVAVTCKTGPSTYKKHFLGLSDNVSYFAEQVDGANVSAYNYRVVFKPAAIVPDIELRK
jgi:hypothetical protein